MRCSACGSENRPGARFCNGCGVALAATCASCGQVNPAGSRFCDACGQPLTASVRPGTPVSTVPPASPRSYTPRHLAEKILTSRSALEGERKQVTVLFADVVGSTELIRDLDPEDARTVLEPAVSAMLSAVHRFEGTVCRVMGDGIMALFGAPLAHEDHAARACYAALTMQEAIRAYGAELRERRGLEVLARVGLNSGEVVVGAISNDLYVEYSAIGPTTHLAARMEQLAVPGTVRLTAETLRLVDGLVETSSLGRIPVKGLDQPVAAFELLGAGPSRRRFQAAAVRGLTPFVGRQAELDALGRALELARNGQGQIVAPVGEPGVGKSRLLYEFVHSHRTQGWLVLESGSVSVVYPDAGGGRATSYLPVLDLLKAYCRIEPRDDPRTVREKLTGKLLALDPSLSAILSPLLALLDLSVGEETWATLDPAGRRRATLDALRRLLLRESQEQPLVLVFEDLHWIDAETQALLDSLVEALPTARILLLVNFRPEYGHTWGNKSFYTQLRIDPLGQASASELLDALLGGDSSVEPLKPLLVDRTSGNPFFLEESVRALIETGALVGERGAYTLMRPVASLRVPASVQAVLAARIDRLPAEEKRLLQTAAVIGKDVPFALLQPIAEAPDAELQDCLSRLQAGELLYAVSLFPELELTFKHALTHEVAYGGLLQERRRALHARIVAAIETLYADRLDEHVERLAEHAFRAELWEQAAAYGRQAGAKADGRAAYSEAVAAFERTLVALARLPETVETLRDAVDVRLELRQPLRVLGDRRRHGEALGEAERLAERLGDRRRLALVYQFQAFVLVAAEPDRGVELARRAVAIGEALDDAGLLATTRYYLGHSLTLRGDYREALAVLRLNLSPLASDPRLGGAPVSLTTRAWLGHCLSELGEFDEAAALGEEILQSAQQDGRMDAVIQAMLCVADVARARDDHPTAIRWYERVIELSRTHGVQFAVFLGTAYLGQTLVRAGRPSEARPLLERGLLLLEQVGNLFQYTSHLGWLARACDAEGDVARALDLARQSVEQAAAQGHRGVLAENRWHLATILAHAGESDADGTYGEALSLAKELGMRPLQAHCHLGLGKLYRKLGRAEDARAELSRAITLFREMGMTFWLPEAEEELTRADTVVGAERLG